MTPGYTPLWYIHDTFIFGASTSSTAPRHCWLNSLSLPSLGSCLAGIVQQLVTDEVNVTWNLRSNCFVVLQYPQISTTIHNISTHIIKYPLKIFCNPKKTEPHPDLWRKQYKTWCKSNLNAHWGDHCGLLHILDPLSVIHWIQLDHLHLPLYFTGWRGWSRGRWNPPCLSWSPWRRCWRGPRGFQLHLRWPPPEALETRSSNCSGWMKVELPSGKLLQSYGKWSFFNGKPH